MSEGLKHLKQYGTGTGGAWGWARPSLPAEAVYGTGTLTVSVSQMTFCVAC